MTVLLGIAVLTALIVIHEGGHFLAAKSLGAKAPIFSIGFGPKLWGFTRGGTEYRLSAIPLGGYVLVDDEAGGLSWWRRVIFFIAGPLANFIAALVIYVSIGAPLEFLDKLNAMGHVLVALFTGQIAISDLSGPVGIVRIAGQTASEGATAFMRFAAFLSINLGVLNLLPLPVLDGGQIIIALLEGAMGKPLGTRLRIAVALATWGLLFGLFLYVTAIDIVRVVSAASVA